jgi:hypothetical protein
MARGDWWLGFAPDYEARALSREKISGARKSVWVLTPFAACVPAPVAHFISFEVGNLIETI